MPLTHTSQFRVRHYECDAYGHLNNLNYLRLMQEAAFDASAAAGYDLLRYQAMDRHWVVRQTEINFFSPAGYGDEVEVKTWLSGHRRVRCKRAYEFRLRGSADLVAQAETDWIFLDSNTGRPVAIPRDLLAAFFPEGAPPMDSAGPPFPELTTPPDQIYRVQQRVGWRDVGALLHVNNAVYLSFVEDCGLGVAEAFGWSLSRMWDEGFGIIVKQHRIQYLQEARLGDDLEISTWAGDFRRATALRHFVISRPGEETPVAIVDTWWVWVDNQTGRLIRIPPHFVKDFLPNLSPDSRAHSSFQ